jgi:hypothetical protein
MTGAGGSGTDKINGGNTMDTHLMERLDTAIVEDKENGLYRCRRDVFTDPEWFELEMKHIFEGNWIYLAHESQRGCSGGMTNLT